MRRRNSATSISQEKPTRTRMGKGKRIDSQERQKAIKPEYLEANKKHCQRGEGKILSYILAGIPYAQLMFSYQYRKKLNTYLLAEMYVPPSPAPF